MITLGGDAELELVDSLDPFSEGIVFRYYFIFQLIYFPNYFILVEDDHQTCLIFFYSLYEIHFEYYTELFWSKYSEKMILKRFFFLSVRPPNKSWKNISNLSGGEKTLSSLALVRRRKHNYIFKTTRIVVLILVASHPKKNIHEWSNKILVIYCQMQMQW